MWLVWRPMRTEGLKLGPVVLYHLNPPHSPPSPAQNQFRQALFEGNRWHLNPLRWIDNLLLAGGSTSFWRGLHFHRSEGWPQGRGVRSILVDPAHHVGAFMDVIFQVNRGFFVTRSVTISRAARGLTCSPKLALPSWNASARLRTQHAIQGIIREGSALFPVQIGAPPPFSGSRQGVLSVKC